MLSPTASSTSSLAGTGLAGRVQSAESLLSLCVSESTIAKSQFVESIDGLSNIGRSYLITPISSQKLQTIRVSAIFGGSHRLLPAISSERNGALKDEASKSRRGGSIYTFFDSEEDEDDGDDAEVSSGPPVR